MDFKYFINRIPTVRKFPYHVFVNQLGYKPDSTKIAVLNAPADVFSLVDNSGKICYSGNTFHFGFDELSGDDVYLADFSAFTQAGNYTIKTDSAGESLTFSIDENVYENVFFDLNKAYYFLRCGCELDEKFAGKFHHAKCHTEKAVLWENHDISLDVSGGWHDAGDYGRYVTAAACAVAHLLYAFRIYNDKFIGLNLNIPESGEALPDILAEIKYELLWILKMQCKDGAVYHKATTAQHAPFVMPEDDKAQMFVLPVSSIATADFVAVCALASGVYRQYDEAFAERLLRAAEKSCKWLDENQQFIGFENPSGCGTGGYGEATDVDNRYWAWAEMFAATGEAYYHKKMLVALKNDFSHTDLGYGSIGGLGSLAYILCNKFERDDSLVASLKSEFIICAESLALLSDKCRYSAAMTAQNYTWGSNMSLLKHGMIFAIADYLENSDRFKFYAEAQLHYLLGVNASGFSYVTEEGEFSCNQPHFRPTFADGVDECIPGFVSGGANANPSDPVAKTLIPVGTPPMKCFVDDIACFSLNEITIYWNSPAVFLVAYLC